MKPLPAARLALATAGITAATAAHAEPAAPQVGHIDDAARARLEAAEAAMTPEARRLEIQESCVPDAEPGPHMRGADVDNDGCHYARGSTIVVHVFVNHDGGTWSPNERSEAAAKAETARQLYLDWAPSNAYMSFDHEGSSTFYFYTADLPYDVADAGYFETYMVDDAAADLGFNDSDGDGSRIDQMTTFLQGFDGGWDNVILVFQPADYHFNPATASFGTSWTRVGIDHSSSVWAHEWGHLFGACDEYSTADCNGLYCPDICQSWYLNDQVPNGNCELGPCSVSNNCLMRYNWTGSPPCSYTQRNWAWVDDDDDGLLDATLRWDADETQLENIFDLYHNGWFIHTNTDWNWVANQRWTSWSAIGVRSRNAASYGIQVYGENNHQIHHASSFLNEVNFVVGDFNHNNLGQDHVSLINVGGAGQYVLSYEGGNAMLFPDGVVRNSSWDDRDVVRTYDVPLIGGETVQFILDVDPGLDLGMALFKSNGDTYYAPPTSAELFADSFGGGISESFTYEVPEDDVYGLVLFSTTEVDGDFSVKIGPTLQTLAEETPFTSFLDLRLYGFTPIPGYWAVAATRPGDNTNVRISLYEESTFETLHQTSGAYPNVEFVAADYSFGASTDYLRVPRQSGVNSHTTEWEQSADLLGGFEALPWDAGHVAKVWDVYMRGGETYMLRQYEGLFTPLDAAIFLMSSADGDPYKQRSGQSAGSNSGNVGGEWFTFTAPEDDFYGLVMIAHDAATTANYSVAVGPRVSLDDNEPVSVPDELVWSDFTTVSGSWTAVGARADPGSVSSIAMWDCENYGVACFETAHFASSGVSYVVIDGNHQAPATYYARGDRESGTDPQTISFDNAPSNDIAFDDPDEIETADGTFATREALHMWDLTVAAAPATVRVTVTPLESGLDLGVAIFSSGDGTYVKPATSALVESDGAGGGTSEVVVFDAPAGDVYGLVVLNQNGRLGDYRIEIRHDDNVVDVPVPSALPNELALRARGGVAGGDVSTFEVDLPETGRVDLEVFDVQGRRVRRLTGGTLAAGTHAITWDGRGATGGAASSGLYFVRLRALGEGKTLKLVRLE